MELRTQVSTSQFDGKDVVWYPDTYNLDEIVNTFKLPVLVKVVDGYMINEIECLENGTILSIHGVCSMDKIIATDYRDTELYIPVSCENTVRLSVKDNSTFKYVADICNATPVLRYVTNMHEFTHQKQTYPEGSVFLVRSVSKWSKGLNVTHYGQKEQRLTLPFSIVGNFKEVPSPLDAVTSYFIKDLVNNEFPIFVEFESTEGGNTTYGPLMGKVKLRKLLTSNIVYGTNYDDGKKKLLTFSRSLGVRLQIGRVIVEDDSMGEYSTIAEPVEEPIDEEVLQYILHMNPYYGDYNTADYAALKATVDAMKGGKTVESDARSQEENNVSDCKKVDAPSECQLEKNLPKVPPRIPKKPSSIKVVKNAGKGLADTGYGSITHKQAVVQNMYQAIDSMVPPAVPQRSPRLNCGTTEVTREFQSQDEHPPMGTQEGNDEEAVYSHIADGDQAMNAKPALSRRTSTRSNSSTDSWQEKALAFSLPLNTAAKFCYGDEAGGTIDKNRPLLPLPSERQGGSSQDEGTNTDQYNAVEELSESQTNSPRRSQINSDSCDVKSTRAARRKNMYEDIVFHVETEPNIEESAFGRKETVEVPSAGVSRCNVPEFLNVGEEQKVEKKIKEVQGLSEEHKKMEVNKDEKNETLDIETRDSHHLEASKKFDVISSEVLEKSVIGICEILEKLCLAEFKELFIDTQIDGELLGDINEADLVSDVEMSLFQARKLYLYIRGWQLDEEVMSFNADESQSDGEMAHEDPEKWTVKDVFERMKSLKLSSFAEFCSEQQVNGTLLTKILDEEMLESVRKDHGVSLRRIEEKKLNNYVLKGWRPK
eukprot:gene7599-13406_t